MPAWREPDGTITLKGADVTATTLRLPCGKCIGCEMNKALGWTLRCRLELPKHQHSSWATLTYAEKYVPPTLQWSHVADCLKRLRQHIARSETTAASRLRFFASGEYGETYGRPHYHIVLFGFPHTERLALEKAWRLGRTQLVAANSANIAYTAGYTAKKAEDRHYSRKHERVDPETGEVYIWQPPFFQMSRRPGIAGHARQWPQSWRSYAISDGTKQPVPRFLHQSWLNQATDLEKEELLKEKAELALSRDTTTTEGITNLVKAEVAAHALRAQRATKRRLD